MMSALVDIFLAHRHSRQTWDPTQAGLGKERRIFLRKALTVPCKMDNPLYGLESEGSTTNVSLGGMGLIAPVSWPEGSQVKVRFESLHLSGMVVYRQDPGMSQEPCRYGIKFQKLSIRDLFKLRSIIHGRSL